jgi:uncharacterized protein YbaR (Trm112 family)
VLELVEWVRDVRSAAHSRTFGDDSGSVGRACQHPGRRVEFGVPQHCRFVQEAIRLAIHSDLLEILVCPACKAKVELKADGSGLVCPECHRVYPIRDDIPVMLIDEARIEEDGDAA